MGGLSDVAGHLHLGDAGAHAGDLGAHGGGDASIAMSADHGDLGVDHGHGANGDAGHHHFSLLTFLSPLQVASFFFGFGALGVLTRIQKMALIPSAGYAAIGGLLTWAAAYLILTQMFGKSQGTSHSRREEMIGLRAQVIAPIAGERPGMVAYTVAGTRQSLPAITEDEEPIPMGATVRIRKVRGNTASVVRID